MGMYPFCKDVKGIIYTDMCIKFLRLDLNLVFNRVNCVTEKELGN